MKIMVVYDSLTGNTEKMAHAVAEGAGSVAGIVVEVRKIGEPFALSMMAKADGVIFGSPCNYANVTPGMRGFLDNLKGYIRAGKMDVKGKRAAIFGSYGWDGAYVMEELFKKAVQNLGFRVKNEVCVEVGTNIKYHPDEHLAKCKAWGKDFAEYLKK
ncbi:FprA family A-type flavoprotein [Candidatus Bathyarchaeota archaeon]|nr:MAG: FprA family A-type flavoprotein [Candidatus Bathyarchaeota archaeon]